MFKMIFKDVWTETSLKSFLMVVLRFYLLMVNTMNFLICVVLTASFCIYSLCLVNIS